MKSRFFYFAPFAAAVLALSGCEWGGSHEDTWNDGYSWASFTGTYRFVDAKIIPSSDDSGEETQPGEVLHTDGTGNGKMETSSKASGKVNPVGLGIVPATFSMGIGISDSDGDGVLRMSGQAVGGVTYATGAWYINQNVGVAAGTHFGISYHYKTTGGIPPRGTQEASISYLNVIQHGNKFTMTGDSGMVYNGRITGSNVGRNDWQAARTVYMSFEASSANGQKMTGTFSGVWSGASDKSYGTLSNRRINGTHSRAGNFVGVAADKTIRVYDVTTSETGPSSYSSPSESSE